MIHKVGGRRRGLPARLVAAILGTALAAGGAAADVPPPERLKARIVVNGRTSTAVEIPVVNVGQEIPATYAGAQIAAVPGFEFYVSEHFALRSSMGDEHARRLLEISELAHPHWVALIGAEPPDPARRMLITYGKNPEELHRAMVADIGMGPLGGFAGGFTAATNRSTYNFPSGTLEYHQRALLIHENLHMLTMICHDAGGTEGPTYAGEQHVYDPAAKRLTVFCFDKACVNNYTDDGLAALRERFIPMHEAVRKLWQGGGGPGTVYQQFFLTDPDRLLKWRIWRDEYYAGRVNDDTNAEIMTSIHGPLERLDEEWTRWVRDRRASFHYVDWGWEQDSNTLRAYGFPADPKFWSQTDVRLPPGEELRPDPLRLDYPAEPPPPHVGPVARGGDEPTTGFVVAGVDGRAWGGFGLGVEGRSMCRVVIVGGQTLVVDGEPLGMTRQEFPLTADVRQAAAADGGRHGVTIRIGRDALTVTVRAGPADRLTEIVATVPLDEPQRRRLLERPLAIIGKDGWPRVTPWIADGREPPPDFSQPAPANRWRFAGLDQLETLYRAAWRLGAHAPESLLVLKTEMLLAVDARPERQAEAVADYEARIDAVARAVAGCTTDEATKARALADLSGVFIRIDTAKPVDAGHRSVVTGRLTARLADPIDVRVAVVAGREGQPAGEAEAFTLEPRRPREFRREIDPPAGGRPATATATITITLTWRGRTIEVPFELALAPAASPSARGEPTAVLGPETLRRYVAEFNATDNEMHRQHVPNADAAEFLVANVPLFECPDAEIERTYYFRWWTYRKHIKQTPDGFVITEFLPPVKWASEHNAISCPVGHQLYEGRWLRDPKYLDDYTTFWLRRSAGLHRYSHWLADAIWARYCVNADDRLPRDLLPDLVRNFRQWEAERRDPNGLFWQVDGVDGMEVAIGGTGYRPTINSYMYGDAQAIAAIAGLAGQPEVAREFGAEAARLKRLVQERLWDADAQFFKMRKRPAKSGDPEPPLADVRELHGFTPWYFRLPDPEYAVAWRQLRDPQGFAAPFGPTTAEQRHRQFKVIYRGHECQWNGPSWPYATAVTLVALANLLNDQQQDAVTKEDYFETLKCYTRSHALREQRMEVSYADKQAGSATASPQTPVFTPAEVPKPEAAVLDSLDRQPWIDENLNPYTGDWIARSLLRERRQKPEERGKDYNHSTYCDLIITGLVGLRPRPDDVVEVHPLAPAGWDYFCLDAIPYHGRMLTILWDRTGDRYHRGAGLRVFADGTEIARGDTLSKLTGQLP